MDLVTLLGNLHDAQDVSNPQKATINEKQMLIEYYFVPRIQGALTPDTSPYTYACGFADALRTLASELTVEFNNKIKKSELESMDVVDFQLACEVKLTYVAKTQEEFDKIKEIFRKRAEFTENPALNQTVFIYD